MLAVTLLLVLLLSLGFFLSIKSFKAGGFSTPDKEVKKYCVIYAWLIALILCWAVFLFLGVRKHGSPQIPVDKLRRLSHMGYYFQPQGEAVITGKIEEEGFKHDALDENEKITLKPLWNDKEKEADRWTIGFNTRKHPLRFDDVCVNLPENHWFQSNDALVIAGKEKNRPENESAFVSIRWESKTRSLLGFFKETENFYYYNEGTIINGRIEEKRFEKDILLTKKMLKEGFVLSALISLYRGEGMSKIKSRRWWSAAAGIKFIRKKKNVTQYPRSPMGVLLADSLFVPPEPGKPLPFKFYKWEAQGELIPLERMSAPDPMPISYKTRIWYGFGHKNALDIKLSNKAENDVDDHGKRKLGSVMEIKFNTPQSWPLHTEFEKNDKKIDFLITSSKEHSSLYSYFIDVGNTLHPFYAKVQFNKDKDAINMMVNDGRSTLNPGIDETVRLGDFKSGILIALSASRSAVPCTGPLALGFILLLTVLFQITTKKEKKTILRFNLTWALVWGITLTLLTVRLILSYRVSLLPPEDANPLEVANVFHKSLQINVWGLLLLPLFLLLVRFLSSRIGSPFKKIKTSLPRLPLFKGKSGKRASGWKKWAGDFLNRLWAVLKIPLVLYTIGFIILLVGARVYGENESFIGRLNIIAHIYIILGVTGFAPKILAISTIKSRFLKILAAAGLFLVPVLTMIVIEDLGFSIYCISLGICILIALLSGTRQRIWRRVVITLIILTIVFIGVISHIPSLPFFQETFDAHAPSRVVYRMVGFSGTEEKKLLNADAGDNVEMVKLLRNSHQNWQMQIYASQGIHAPRGYGQTPLSNRGMTYPTSMTDCVYSIFLLPEHGRWTGIFIILLYVLLGGVILYGACSFTAKDRHRLLPLTAIGLYFAVNAVYMAAANLGLVVFTGQNIPLLSLPSKSDLIQGAILLAVLAVLLKRGLTNSSVKTEEAISGSLKALILLLAVVAGIGFWMRMGQLAHPKYRQDHNFDKKLFDKIRDNLPSRGKNDWLVLMGEKIISLPWGKLLPIEKSYINEFNSRVDKYDPNLGLYYLEAPEDRKKLVVRINENFFKLRSPYRDSKYWQGKIYASSREKAPTIMALNHPFRISLSRAGHPTVIYLDSKKESQVATTNSAVVFRSRKLDQQFFELLRDDSTRQLKMIPVHSTDWIIYVEGKAIDSQSLQPLRLDENSLVVIEKRFREESFSSGDAYRYNLIYLGYQSPILASVQWRNGEDKRLFPEGDLFPMAFALGKAADDAMNADAVGIAVKTSDLDLTLDLQLHQELHHHVARYAQRHPWYNQNEEITQTKILAVSVMDTFSGKILAIPSWPVFDPGDSQFEKDFKKMSGPTISELLRNNNLKNHHIGSTVKPLIFSTIAAGFHPKMDPAELAFYHKKETLKIKKKKTDRRKVCPHTVIGNIPLGNIPFDLYYCGQPNYTHSNAADFLVQSRNYCEVFLGMLGMLVEKDDWDKIQVFPTNKPDIDFKSRAIEIDLKSKTLHTPAFTIGGPIVVPRPSAMNKTILFKGLKEWFDVGVCDDRDTLLYRRGLSFMPSLFPDKGAGKRYMRTNNYLDEVLPQVVNFPAKDFQKIRQDIVTFFLGANYCSWNNIQIMEALTRVITGKPVTAFLEKKKSSEPLVALENPGEPPTMPKPLDDKEWRYKNLLEPLRKAYESGTGKELKKELEKLKVNIRKPYRLILKTGTIEERNKKRESELLFFVIGKFDEENKEYVPGLTLSCFFYMENSKAIHRNDKDGNMKKFHFAAPIVRILLDYLEKKELEEEVIRRIAEQDARQEQKTKGIVAPL